MQNDPLENYVAPTLGAARGFATAATSAGPVRRKHRVVAWMVLLWMLGCAVFMVIVGLNAI